MLTLKKIISRYMYKISCILVVVILLIVFYVQLKNEQRLSYESSIRTFSQIEQVLEENQKELDEIKQDYKETCLHNAEVIAYIIEGNKDIMNSVDELKELAVSVEVDEIHIFDKTGRIFAGTHPEYYNLTMDSGEQISFFKPMLKDKSLKLVQDITPNSAEEKLMQYSAVWSKNGEYIIQVGMEPVNVMKVTEKNELSYIFSLFRVNPEADYYAINVDSGEVVGSTDLNIVGRNIAGTGLTLKDISNNRAGFHTEVNGQSSYCVFKKIGTSYIGRVISSRNLYQRIPSTIFAIFMCLMTIAYILATAVTRHMNKYVVDEIQEMNEKMELIANGNLEENIKIKSSAEFYELSEYINMLVKSLLDNNKKMSYVLSKTNLYIGVYEYNDNVKKVRITEYVPKILYVGNEEMENICSDVDRFKAFMNDIRKNSIPDEPGIFKVGNHPEHYVRLEESRQNKETFGVIIDVTAEVLRRRKIEEERDIDLLTELFNRRGLETKLSALFNAPDRLGHSAMVMIDADGLKGINDTYGHEMGDAYLNEIAGIIEGFGTRKSIASRQGGDEFVLFMYGYDTEDELMKSINLLEEMQSNTYTNLDVNIRVPLRFSMGYCLTEPDKDYTELLKEADKKMYSNKMERKKSL